MASRGQRALRGEVRRTDKRDLTDDAYFDEAEQEMDGNFDRGRSVGVEIRPSNTFSGVPEIIDLDPKWFDARNDED